MFNTREKELLISALCTLEHMCYCGELYEEIVCDIETDLKGLPDPVEVQDLMDKITGNLISVRVV